MLTIWETLTILAAIGTVVAAIAAVWSLIIQLKQASRQPKITVTDVQIVKRENDSEVVEIIHQINDERKQANEDQKEIAAYEQRLAEWKKRKEERDKDKPKPGRFDHLTVDYSLHKFSYAIDPEPMPPFALSNQGLGGVDHGGYFPNVIVQITLKNTGMVAARNVGGTVYLQASHLYPVYFPGLDLEEEEQTSVYSAVSDENGFYKAKLLATSEDLLHNDKIVLRVGAIDRPRSSENLDQPMTVKYSFITPSGYGYANEHRVSLP